jgi:hypothetical protein
LKIGIGDNLNHGCLIKKLIIMRKLLLAFLVLMNLNNAFAQDAAAMT